MTAEYLNRHADALATQGAALHHLPAALTADAEQRHRFAEVLHSAAVAIYDINTRAL